MQQELSATPSAEVSTRRSIVKLDGELGIDQIQTLHDELIAHLEDPDTVEIDASEVERVHTAALQLFCLFCRDRRAAGRDVTLQKPSEALRSAAALLGATTLLNFAQVHHDSGQ